MKRKQKGHRKKRTRTILDNFTFKTLFFTKSKYPPISYQRALLMKSRNSNEVMWEMRVLELPVPSILRPIGQPVPIRLFKLTPAPFCTSNKYN